MPFNLAASPLPLLPNEIWANIIDCIADRPSSWKKNKTLYVCTLVCRSWLYLARLHIFKDIYIPCGAFSKFQNTFGDNPVLTRTRRLRVSCESNPLSMLFGITKLENLEHLRLIRLDLSKRCSFVVPRSVSRSVTRLELWSVHCGYSCLCLIRLLNSFRSLTSLIMTYHSPLCLGYDEDREPLPRSYPIPGRSLTDLKLEVSPVLIDY